MNEQNSKFEGWAVVEMFGHMREAGYVTTEYFGSGALFRIEVPPLPEREVTLIRPEWIEADGTESLAGAGSKISRGAVEGRTRFIGPGAVYAMNPCSQDAAFAAIEAMTRREVKIVELVKAKQLATTLPGEDEQDNPMPPEDDEPEEDEDFPLPAGLATNLLAAAYLVALARAEPGEDEDDDPYEDEREAI